MMGAYLHGRGSTENAGERSVAQAASFLITTQYKPAYSLSTEAEDPVHGVMSAGTKRSGLLLTSNNWLGKQQTESCVTDGFVPFLMHRLHLLSSAHARCNNTMPSG